MSLYQIATNCVYFTIDVSLKNKKIDVSYLEASEVFMEDADKFSSSFTSLPLAIKK